MTVSVLRTHNKGIRAFVGLMLTWAFTARHGGISADEAWDAVFIIAGTLGVVDGRNTHQPLRERPIEWGDPAHRAPA